MSCGGDEAAEKRLMELLHGTMEVITEPGRNACRKKQEETWGGGVIEMPDRKKPEKEGGPPICVLGISSARGVRAVVERLTSLGA